MSGTVHVGAVLAEPLRPVDGTVTARGPGLGMDWDEDAVARYRYPAS